MATSTFIFEISKSMFKDGELFHKEHDENLENKKILNNFISAGIPENRFEMSKSYIFPHKQYSVCVARIMKLF
jgi:hypothetical protein